MGFGNLFIRSRRSLAGVEFDAVIREEHTNQVRVTTNPIETGAEIADHAVVEPKVITIVGEVSDNPLFGISEIGSIVDPITRKFGTSTLSNETRTKAAYETLVAFMERREPTDVQTKLKNYVNMLITGISTVQDKDSGKIVNMIITLQEMLITESETVDLNSSNLQEGVTTEQASTATSSGRQETIEPSSSENKSVIKKVSEWIGGQ